MPITVKLDDVLHDRRMTLTELAERIDMVGQHERALCDGVLQPRAKRRETTGSGLCSGLRRSAWRSRVF